jgi:hypothetical protein
MTEETAEGRGHRERGRCGSAAASSGHGTDW